MHAKACSHSSLIFYTIVIENFGILFVALSYKKACDSVNRGRCMLHVLLLYRLFLTLFQSKEDHSKAFKTL